MYAIKRLIVIIAISILIISQPAFADNQTNSNNTGVYIKAGGLCVGGAILGTFIPIFGNIVGCAIGATAGYFWGKSPTEDPEPITAIDE